MERGSSDLHCIDLHPTPDLIGASGAVELGRVPSAFGVAVTPQGNHVYELTAFVEGLPDPAELGDYKTYIAWATTPFFEPTIKLGELANGSNDLGRVAFNKFLILVTAEASSAVEARTGRLVLRGRSPSLFMNAHDLILQAPAAVLGPLTEEPTGEPAEGNGWEKPPMHPRVPMLPGMMRLEPEVAPLLAEVDAIDDLPWAKPGQLVRLGNGGTLDLEAGVVRRKLQGETLVMLGFNDQHPGPLIQVPEKSTIFVNFTNETPFPTSVHWHGVRLDNRFDGVPGVTQDAVLPGETFRYQIYFRDPGIYWYHPHHREDIQQELGLYGNMLVDSPREDYYGPVSREAVLMLDDLLLGDSGVVPFGDESANYMLMGRFGNIFLVNGEPSYELDVKRGEVVRFFFTNASNTRTFNVSFQQEPGDPRSSRGEGARGVIEDAPAAALPVKVVGSDVGKFERETMAESVVLAPAERYVVEVRFDEPGEVHLNNQVQAINHRFGTFFPEVDTLGIIRVSDEEAEDDHAHAFEVLRENADVISDIDRYRDEFDRPVDLELLLTLEVKDLPLAIEQVMLFDWIYFNPVEWSGTMPIMNWLTSAAETSWILREPSTGRQNTEIDWRFRVGDVVKIRLRNDRDAWHSMQHPLHIHGQRFLVLEQDGVPNPNLVWKDTVLLPTGSTTDILLELSNPGRWMFHCHISEHLESGMKLVFEVDESATEEVR